MLEECMSKIEVALLRSCSRTNIEFIFFFLDFYNLNIENMK